jgi:hypothetical protein
MVDIMPMRDYGLTYEEAAHGVQSAIKYEMDREKHEIRSTLKHLRVGVDMRAADARALAELLIAKGVFTADEYIEYMRLAANEELARYTEHVREKYDLPMNVEFR